MVTHDRLIDELEQQGWSVSDDILPAALAQGLRLEGERRWASGGFRPAGIGRAQQQQLDQAVRGDAICWLEADDTAPAVRDWLVWCEDLQQQLNRAFYLGLRRFESHFARYDAGAGYDRHLDQHQNTDFRRMSLVLYLNEGWQPDDGGELAIYDAHDVEREVARVAPRFGRVALFRSDTIPHAVLPCRCQRWSVTGWFRTDEPGLPGAWRG